MKEIKFKGIEMRTLRSVCGDYYVHKSMTEHRHFITKWKDTGIRKEGIDEFNSQVFEIYRDTLEQFTGEKDINGNEIYEPV